MMTLLSAVVCTYLLMRFFPLFFFFNDTATTEIYTLSLHDALPILRRQALHEGGREDPERMLETAEDHFGLPTPSLAYWRSEEHTSELQSRLHLVCRLLLEKKKKHTDR